MEFKLSGAKVFLNLARQIRADSLNVSQGSSFGNRFDVVGEAFDCDGSPAVSTYSKWIRTLNFQQVGDLIEHGGYLEVSHVSTIQNFYRRIAPRPRDR